MEPELSLLSPPATPPLELNKVSWTTWTLLILKIEEKSTPFKYMTYMTKGIPFYQQIVRLRAWES